MRILQRNSVRDGFGAARADRVLESWQVALARLSRRNGNRLAGASRTLTMHAVFVTSAQKNPGMNTYA